MPAMPPTSAVPLLRTLRRVTVVMDSSLGDSAGLTPAWSPFQSIAPPWFNACARSGVRNTLSRRSFVGVSTLPASVAISARDSVNSSQNRHCSRHMNHTAISAPSRAAAVCRRRASFPRLMKAWYRNAGATSFSPVAAGNQVLPLVRRPLSHFGDDEKGDRLVELVFWAAIEGVEPLPLEFEGRHEVIDGFDLGFGKHRFVEGDSLGDVVIEPEERCDGGHDGCPCWLGSDEPVSFVLCLEGCGAGEIGDGQINEDRWPS